MPCPDVAQTIPADTLSAFTPQEDQPAKRSVSRTRDEVQTDEGCASPRDSFSLCFRLKRPNSKHANMHAKLKPVGRGDTATRRSGDISCIHVSTDEPFRPFSSFPHLSIYGWTVAGMRHMDRESIARTQGRRLSMFDDRL